MTTMIEKVARAICAATPGTGNVDEHFADDSRYAKGFWMTIARAAIEAMGEPTEEMVDAGRCHKSDAYSAVAYQSMIDAALKEGK